MRQRIFFFAMLLVPLMGYFDSFSQSGIDSSMILWDSNGIPRVMRYQAIVKFRSDAFIPGKLMDPALISGPLRDFVSPNLVDTLELYSGVSLSTARRLVDWLDPTIMYSISRGGDTVEMPDFRNMLLVDFDGMVDPYLVSSNLSSLTKIVHWAEPNALGFIQWIPNDPDYQYQKGLQAGTNANGFNCTSLDGAISMQGAWDLEKGKEYIKVGVIDKAVDWRHPDFGNGTLSGNVIKGGWDYGRDIPVSTITPLPQPFGSTYGIYKHGTQIAGIIGARSNDNTGVSGIAGGDLGNQEPGISLYTMQVFSQVNNPQDWPIALASDFVPAIVDGASDIPNGPSNHAFGCHILNNSWTTSIYLQSLREAVGYAWRNETTVVASRGNWDDEPGYAQWSSIDEPLWPSCIREEWVLNVGGSNECGEPKKGFYPNGDGNDANPADDFSATMIDHDVDLIAPMTELLVSTTSHSILDQNGFEVFGTTPYNGTSVSAALASGVAALLMSYFNVPSGNGFSKYLAPEDIEFILEHSAVQHQQLLGNLPNTIEGGWGIINANAALHFIERPIYDIIHCEGVGADVALSEGVHWYTGDGPLGYGTYQLERFRVEKAVSHNIGQNSVIINHWGRPSGSKVFDNNNLNWQHSYVYFDGVPASSSADMYGYTYKVLAYYNLPLVVNPNNYWFPANPSDCKFAYSLRIQNLPLETEEVRTDILEIVPNPSNDNVKLLLNGPSFAGSKILIFNTSGILVHGIEMPISGKSVESELDVSNFPAGIYVVRIEEETGTVWTKRFSVVH